MVKNPKEKATIRKKRSETAKEIAALVGCSTSQVRKVMNGDRDDDDILAATVLYEQGKKKLLQKISELVPFNR